MRLLFAEDEKALSKALTAILERNDSTVDAVYDGQRQGYGLHSWTAGVSRTCSRTCW